MIISIDYCNSWSLWFSSHGSKPNPMHNPNLNEIEKNYASNNANGRSIDVSENSGMHEPTYNSLTQQPAIDTTTMIPHEDTWVDLAISVSSLAVPYMPESIKDLDIDWNQAQKFLRVFESSVTTSYNDPTVVARELLPAAAPLMFDVTRSIIEAALDIMEKSDTHSVVRRSIDARKEVVEKMMKAFESLVYFVTGYDVGKYRDVEDL